MGKAPAIEIDADELYGNTESIEELAGIETGQLSDAGNLLDALNDEIQVEDISEEEDLMLALSLDAEVLLQSRTLAATSPSKPKTTERLLSHLMVEIRKTHKKN